MKRRRYSRIPVKLHATLIGEKTVPRGCRIIDLGQQGALLQCEPDGRVSTFNVGDAVVVHFTLRRRTDGHRRLKLRATVRHVNGQNIGIEFEHPDPELILSFEANRGGDVERADSMAEHEDSVQLLRDSDLIPNLTAPHDAVGNRAEDTGDRQVALARGNLKLRYLGLTFLAFAVIFLAGAYIYNVQVDTRFSRLEAAIAAHARNHRDSADQRSTPGLLETRMDRLKERMDQLENSLHERKVPHTLSDVPPRDAVASPAETVATPSNSTKSQAGADAMREPVQPETPPEMIKPDIERRGPWVINVLSSQNRDAADRFSANARAKDIPVTQTMARVKGTQYWRVQLTGFATVEEAEAHAEVVKQRLGLKEVWIFRGVNQ